jgi:photosystem II stability/assembly factor-like uncharacterized protein
MRIGNRGAILAGAALVAPAPLAAQQPQRPVRPVLAEQASGTTALLQAVSAVNDTVAWVSGHRATWARTTDGGRTWTAGAMAGPDSVLQFRDVHALSADSAWLLAAGPGERSRIYFTTDGGRSWRLQFLNRDTSAFFDCFDFWDARRGVAVSDAVNGRMVVIVTDDGGATWWLVPAGGIPAALPGEGAFAASGTCLVARRGGRAWFATGAADGARVYATADYGRTWSVAETPVVHGQAAGVATLAFRDDTIGFALGGRIAEPRDTASVTAAVTTDGGRTWSAATRPPLAGAVFGAALSPGRVTAMVVVGPSGMAFSTDGCTRWTRLSDHAYWAVGFHGARGWAVGPGGRITRLDLEPGC